MLDELRRPGRAKSIFAYTIFGLICLVFVFFGFIPDQYGLGTGGAAAVVNKKRITIADYQDRIDQLRDVYAQRFGGSGAAQQEFIQNMIKSQALESLIDIELIVQGAGDEGMVVADKEVAQTIKDIPAFQEDGRFLRSRYNAFLENRRFSAQEFENKLRKELVLNRLRDVFGKALWPSQEELVLESQASETKANISFIEISRRQLESQYQPRSVKVKEFLKAEKKEVQKYYDENKSEFTQPAKVRARHILVKFTSGDRDSEKKAFEKIQKIQKEAEKADFAALAKKYSEDTGSAKRGGDLDYFKRGVMVPEFEEVAFKHELNKVSAPVKSKFGYHLIKVLDRKEANTKELAAVQNDIAKKLYIKKHVKAFFKNLADKKVVKESVLKKDYKLKWQSTGEFSLAAQVIPKLGEKDRVLQAALAQKNNLGVSRLVEEGESYYLVKLKSFKGAENSTADLNSAERIAYQSSNQSFVDWKEKLKKSASISRNRQL